MPEPDRPLRVLHLTSASSPGGVSRYLYDLCRRMHERGHQVAIAGHRGGWHEFFENAPWPWIEAPLHGGPRQLWRSYHILRRHLAAHPADILHSHYRKAMLVARALTVGRPRHCIATLHGTDVPMTGLHRWLTDFGEHVHTPSVQARQWLIDVAGVAPSRITVVPHGVDVTRFPVATEADRAAARAAWAVHDGATVAAYVGRFGPQKNPHWLLDLAQQTRQSLPNLVLLMIGNGSMEDELRQRIGSQGLADRVRLQTYGDPLPVYQAADALLLPTAVEGFALVVAEAMAVGRPVLRTDTAGTEEQIVPGRTGEAVLVDHDRFLGAATAFLQDRSKLREMGAAAAAHVRANLTLDLQVERTEAMYRSICASPAHYA